jgi:hypothetical protein
VAEIVNLNRFRKARQRNEDQKLAAENRIRFGRTRGEKAAERQTDDKRKRELDGKILPDGDQTPGETS